MKLQKQLRILLLLLPLFAINIANAQTGNNVREYTLENGLTVILDENHDKPEVFGLITVKAGGKNDPADATGMAHYQEHMLFKGTTTLGTTDWEKEKPHIDRIFELYDQLGKTTDENERKEIQAKINEESIKANEYVIPNELSNLINEMGGTNVNAGTGPDYTVYYNTFPSNQILKWLDLYAHRFTDPVFRGFQAELEVVYEEKNLYNDQFQTKLLEEFQKYFFKNHPYGQQTLIGTIDDLKNPSLTKMYDFFKTYYVPNNMALILVGDFNSEEIMPIIEEKFGKWKRGEVPEPKVWEEAPFNGREFHEAKLTPIKIGILGFRAPSGKDDNYVKADIMTDLLNNSYSTGLLDKLSDDGKLLGAYALNLPFQDHGAVLVIYIPKLVGQKLDEAEKIILEEIEKLKKGEFDDETLESIKKSEYISFVSNMENNSNRALAYNDYFTSGRAISDLYKYPDIVKGLTKEDITNMASEIFGENYLSFNSKMGFPKKEKIEKPGFKPLSTNTNERSQYAQHLDKIESLEPTFNTIDFDKDVERISVSNGVELLKVENHINDIFTLMIEYKVGEAEIPLLSYASQAVKYCGAGDLSLNDLKNEFAKIGTTFNSWSSRTSTYIDIKGDEENLDRTLELIGMLIDKPTLEQSKLKTIIDSELAVRKVERSEPDAVANALYNYGLYEDKSSYIDRLSSKELKKLQATEVVDAFKKATTYNVQFRFTGKTSAKDVSDMIIKHIPMHEKPLIDKNELDKPRKSYSENTVFFVNKPKSRQSKMFFYFAGNSFSPEKAVEIEAYNEYIGGGFNGLILQEIREYRSLSYAAGGSFSLPKEVGKPYDFYGYVGTQSDKTLTAMEVFTSLIREMPQKPERTDMIRNYLDLSSQTKRPGFRDLAYSVENWKLLGYKEDPMITKLEGYKNLTWETINNFYINEVKDKPMVYMIVGDKKQIDMKELAKYGKVIEIKEKKLYNK